MLGIWSICIEEIDFVCGRDLGTDKVSNLFFFSRSSFPYFCSLCNWPKGWFSNFFWFFFPLRCFIIRSTSHKFWPALLNHILSYLFYILSKVNTVLWYFCFSILIYFTFQVHVFPSLKFLKNYLKAAKDQKRIFMNTSILTHTLTTNYCLY